MSSVSTIGQNTFLNSQILNIESQLDTLSNEVSSGNKAQTFSGINTVSQLSVQLTNEQTAANGYLTNISNAQTLIDPMQSVLQQITDLANQLRNDALTASSDALPVTQGSGALQAEAQDALNQISALLNTRVGSTYLFGGLNTTTPPMPNFGSASNASSITGQVAGLQTTTPLTTDPTSGDQLYNAIQSFLNNGLTTTTPSGGTVSAPFGYAGQSATPGDTGNVFTASAAVAANATSVTVSQTNDLPVPGQYITFGTIPPENASYQVTSVVGQTINFKRVPTAVGTVTGLDFAVGSGTSISITAPAAVTTVNPAATTTAGTTVPGISGPYAIGATSITVGDPGDYQVGQQIRFSNDANSTYQITGIAGSVLTIGQVVNGSPTSGGLVTAIPAGPTETDIALVSNGAAGAFGSAASGTNQIRVQNIQNYSVGDRVNLGGNYYDITNVNPGTQTITFVQAGKTSGGLTTTVTAGTGATGAATTILNGTAPGATVINVGSTTGVTAGMTVKFSNSSAVYTVTQVVSSTQIQITALGSNYGVGLQDALYSPLPAGPGTVAGCDITAQFGTSFQPLSVQIDNGITLQYGITADSQGFRKVLGAIFALATSNLNTTTQAGFREIASRAAADLQTGSSQVTTLAADLGVKQQTLDATQTRQQNFVTTLQTQLSNLNDVNMAQAVSQLTETQTQLQASFQLLSTMKNLTLANYL